MICGGGGVGGGGWGGGGGGAPPPPPGNRWRLFDDYLYFRAVMTVIQCI
jgi:hypothetical protein